MKVSLILTCYNLEKYISRAIECCLNQTYKDLEIIIIDDCSTDNSLNIINSYKDNRIKVIHNITNLGIGKVRQLGINSATGEYIGFIDGDDWYELDYIETLINEAIKEDADIVSCGLKIIYKGELKGKDTIITYKEKEINTPGEEHKNGKLFCGRHTCNKLIKKSVWDKVVYSTRRFCEDSTSLYYAIDNSNKIVNIPYVGYYYWQNPKSICHTMDKIKMEIYKALGSIDMTNYNINKYGIEKSKNSILSAKVKIDNIKKYDIFYNDYIEELNEINIFVNKYLIFRNYKIVYVLVSDESDTYVQQVLTSILSIKQYNPEIPIFIITDEDTNKTLIGKRSLKEYATIIQTKVPKEYNNTTLISRFIKTNIRHILPGNLLYLDTDTICMGKLNIPFFDKPIGMIKEGNFDTNSIPKEFANEFIYLGYKNYYISNYFNSGVMYIKDTQIVKKFYNDWFNLWKQCINANSFYYKDQPPLYMTNTKYSIIDELPKQYNYQINSIGNSNEKNIKILHVYASDTVRNNRYFKFIEEVYNTRVFDITKY